MESEEGVKHAENIAAVDGVDCIQIGSLDLSNTVVYLWDPANKKVRKIMEAPAKAVLGSDPKQGGAYLAGFVMPHDGPRDLWTRGYHMVSGAVNVVMFRSTAVEDVKRLKMNLIDGSDGEQEREKDADEKY